MKNSKDTIGNGTRDLPTCSAVPQPTAPPCTLTHKSVSYYINEIAAVLWSGFRYTKHNFWCQPVSMVCHYCLDQTEKTHSLEREAKGENRESIFLKLILKYKETKIWKTGWEKKKEKVPSCTRNQTQNLQEGSVPLLLAFWISPRPQNSRVSAPIHDLIRSWMNSIHNLSSETWFAEIHFCRTCGEKLQKYSHYNHHDSQFKYLGSTLTNQNSIREETRAEWIQGMFAIILCRIFCLPAFYPKIQRLRCTGTIILPVVLYGFETWSLTLREEHRLRVFEKGSWGEYLGLRGAR